jgi:Uma2 family endonuclease
LAPAPNRKLDYSFIEATPNDGMRYELVDGELFVNPAPSLTHQRISKRLFRQLEDYFQARSLGEVFYAPIDVILTRHDVFEPDLIVVGDASYLAERGVEGPPILAVEILSPSTRRLDRAVKFVRYAALGIRHYWIVDPDDQRVECFRLAGNAYESLVSGAGDVTLSHPDWDGLLIELAALWR